MVEMNIMSSVYKDIGEVYARLFDHHPFLNGEVKYFLREFEEKRGEREVENLFKILEHVTEIRETQIDKAVQLADQELSNMCANLEVTLRMCNKIIEQEVHCQDNILSERRDIREKEWEAFQGDIADKELRVDHTFEEKEQELKAYYKDLEDKLHIST